MDTKKEKYGTLITMSGDATKPQLKTKGEVAVIPHVCNTHGGWGAGFVLALSRAFGPLPEDTYRMDVSPEDPEKRLGSTSFATLDGLLSDDTDTVAPIVVVANMIAQYGYIDALSNPRPLRYDALFECMVAVAQHTLGLRNFENLNAAIHCPKFGSELAGGNWDFIEKMIEDCWLRRGIDVTVYVWAG